MHDTQTEPCPACGSLLDVTGAQIFAERTCPVCGTPINVRRKFGHYELMSVVGSGGQGVVYRAADNNLNRLVALKLLRTEYSEDPDFVRQFEHEAKLTASINHPNVVRVFSFGADEGMVYLAMELVDGGTMDDLMEKLGRVPEARALQIGIEVAQGLKAGFEKGLIHRDVKPGNVLFAKDGTAKVVDYGLAMFFEQEALASGEIWGTPYYLSPERLNKVPEDFRSDIYSLGAALFHAIAGRPPFEAQDASHVALKHLRTQAVSIQTFAPNVSNATAYVINRTLAKSPDQRQQSYDEFIEQLQFAREEALAKARGGAAVHQKSRLVMEDSEAKKAMSWVTIATLVVFVVGLLVGALLITKGIRGDKLEKGKPAQATSTDIAAFGPGWPETHQLLLDGKYMQAWDGFAELSQKHPEGSNEQTWARVLEGLSAQLAGRPTNAAKALAHLQNGGTQMSKFFAEEVLPRLRNDQKIPAEVTRNYNTNSYQSLAALFFALKNYELEHFDDAGALIRQFASFTPDASAAWVGNYKKLVKPLQEQLDAYALGTSAWTNAQNPKQREQAIHALRELPKQLPPSSKLLPKVHALLGEAEKQYAVDLQLRMRANVVYNGKVKASGHDQQKGDDPRQAVDGDLRTRWAHKREGEKWLAVELSTPKQVGRWVLKTAGAGGEKAELNITDVSFQRSDDGNTWQTVDTVTNNRRDVIDRVVTPFTAKHLRIHSTKGGSKAGDNGFRVFEFEAGEASEQAKADYDPNLAVSMRFSTASDFLFGPIGEPNMAGSVKFDEKGGKYTIKGGGVDIWSTADHFHFAWQPMQGDGEIVARVLSIEKKHDWTKVGVMIRSDLAKEAMFGMMACAPGGKTQFSKRLANAQAATSDNDDKAPLPRWVKLQRQGTTLIGFESADGQQWKEVGRASFPGLPPQSFVGLAVCAHVAGQLSEAQFDNVKVTQK